jgi:hypothetical protein
LIGIRLSKNVSWERMVRNMPPVYFRSVTAERRRWTAGLFRSPGYRDISHSSERAEMG